MRSTTIVVLLILLAPVALALPPPSLTPPLPSNASVLPFNALVNGGFEAGLTSWQRYGHPDHALPVVSPGAAGSASTFLSVNEFYGGGVFQPIAPPLTLGTDLLLDFYARTTTSASRTGQNELIAYANWDPATGGGQATVRVNFSAGDVRYQVWDGAMVAAPAPLDGAWHHYQVLMVGATGTGLLLIDGLPATNANGLALATGNPASVAPANVLILGDTTWRDSTAGPAPDVYWDEIYLGPQI